MLVLSTSASLVFLPEKILAQTNWIYLNTLLGCICGGYEELNVQRASLASAGICLQNCR